MDSIYIAKNWTSRAKWMEMIRMMTKYTEQKGVSEQNKY